MKEGGRDSARQWESDQDFPDSFDLCFFYVQHNIFFRMPGRMCCSVHHGERG